MSSKECTKINHEWFFQKEKEALQNGAGGHFEESRAGSSRKAKNKKYKKKKTRGTEWFCVFSLLFYLRPPHLVSRLLAAVGYPIILPSSPSNSSSPLRRPIRRLLFAVSFARPAHPPTLCGRCQTWSASEFTWISHLDQMTGPVPYKTSYTHENPVKPSKI